MSLSKTCAHSNIAYQTPEFSWFSSLLILVCDHSPFVWTAKHGPVRRLYKLKSQSLHKYFSKPNRLLDIVTETEGATTKPTQIITKYWVYRDKQQVRGYCTAQRVTGYPLGQIVENTPLDTQTASSAKIHFMQSSLWPISGSRDPQKYKSL